MSKKKPNPIQDSEIIHRCRLKICEAELSLDDAKMSRNFLSYRKHISYWFWSLASVSNMLFTDKFSQYKWVLSNYWNNQNFNFIKQYRDNDFHDGNHGFTLSSIISSWAWWWTIDMWWMWKMMMMPGRSIMVGNSQTFSSKYPYMVIGEWFFEKHNESDVSETWVPVFPVNFPWVQYIDFFWPNNKKTNPLVYLDSVIMEYKELVHKAEKLIK